MKVFGLIAALVLVIGASSVMACGWGSWGGFEKDQLCISGICKNIGPAFDGTGLHRNWSGYRYRYFIPPDPGSPAPNWNDFEDVLTPTGPGE